MVTIASCPANAPELSRGAQFELFNQTAWGRHRLQLLVRRRVNRVVPSKSALNSVDDAVEEKELQACGDDAAGQANNQSRTVRSTESPIRRELGPSECEGDPGKDESLPNGWTLHEMWRPPNAIGVYLRRTSIVAAASAASSRVRNCAVTYNSLLGGPPAASAVREAHPPRLKN
jgi:hypothetical protein